ncbi:hypothetical protein K4P33_01795, partial [Staphylococcus epidermidis]|nr:hypothetical protein [Staphylococcus epidermidis]
ELLSESELSPAPELSPLPELLSESELSPAPELSPLPELLSESELSPAPELFPLSELSSESITVVLVLLEVLPSLSVAVTCSSSPPFRSTLDGI